jgi:hypothetical protein
VNDDRSNCLARTTMITQLGDTNPMLLMIDHELFRRPICQSDWLAHYICSWLLIDEHDLSTSLKFTKTIPSIKELNYLLGITLARFAGNCEIIAGLNATFDTILICSDYWFQFAYRYSTELPELPFEQRARRTILGEMSRDTPISVDASWQLRLKWAVENEMEDLHVWYKCRNLISTIDRENVPDTAVSRAARNEVKSDDILANNPFEWSISMFTESKDRFVNASIRERITSILCNLEEMTLLRRENVIARSGFLYPRIRTYHQPYTDNNNVERSEGYENIFTAKSESPSKTAHIWRNVDQLGTRQITMSFAFDCLIVMRAVWDHRKAESAVLVRDVWDEGERRQLQTLR